MSPSPALLGVRRADVIATGGAGLRSRRACSPDGKYRKLDARVDDRPASRCRACRPSAASPDPSAVAAAIDQLKAELDKLPAPTKLADEKIGDQDCYHVQLEVTAPTCPQRQWRPDWADRLGHDRRLDAASRTYRPARVTIAVDGAARAATLVVHDRRHATTTRRSRSTAPPADQVERPAARRLAGRSPRSSTADRPSAEPEPASRSAAAPDVVTADEAARPRMAAVSPRTPKPARPRAVRADEPSRPDLGRSTRSSGSSPRRASAEAARRAATSWPTAPPPLDDPRRARRCRRPIRPPRPRPTAALAERDRRPPQPGAGAGGHDDRRPAADPRRRRLRQDPRPRPPGRLPHRRQGRPALADPGRHVHQPGRRRAARADRRRSSARPARDVEAGHVPRALRPGPAPRRRGDRARPRASSSTTRTTSSR